FNPNSGQLFIGNTGIFVSGANTVTADGKNVTFNADSINAPILLGGGVTITAASVSNLIRSLDLTNASNVSAIQNLQNALIVGGSLQSGSLILLPSNLDVRLSAINIPAGITVTMLDFGSNNPVLVSLNSNSTTKTVTIDGAQQFLATSGAS